MKSKIANFIYDGNRILVFLTSFIFFSSFASFLFLYIDYIAESKIELGAQLRVSVILGLISSFLLLSIVSQMKQSRKFWNMADEIETKIETTESPQELKEIASEDLVELQKLSMGTPHKHELLRLFTIIKTKLKYVE